MHTHPLHIQRPPHLPTACPDRPQPALEPKPATKQNDDDDDDEFVDCEEAGADQPPHEHSASEGQETANEVEEERSVRAADAADVGDEGGVRPHDEYAAVRSVYYCNRAACLQQLGRDEEVRVSSCAVC